VVVTLDLEASSTGDGNLTTSYTVTAVNPALGIAAAIANLVDLNVDTTITSGNPSTVTNSLNPTFANTSLGTYISAGTTLTLDNEIDPNTEPVVPTSSPNVNVNFSGDFLLELFLTTAMAPLDVNSSACTFDLQGAGVTLPAN
jgi:hypothetical protein